MYPEGTIFDSISLVQVAGRLQGEFLASERRWWDPKLFISVLNVKNCPKLYESQKLTISYIVHYPT